MTNITWKYKSELVDENIYSKIETDRNIIIPEEIKVLISVANGATPSKYTFLIGDKERVLGSILSFNENEPDSDSVFTALSVIDNNELLPFGIDPFGNYICYDLTKGVVVFVEHETEEITSTRKGLKDFLNSLY